MEARQGCIKNNLFDMRYVCW